jgi:hypothetical protein
MNGNRLVGVRSLIAFMWAVVGVIVATKFMPEAAGVISGSILALFGILIGRQKANGQNGGQ